MENVLAACLDDLCAGAPLEKILASYPQYTADLAPLLAIAAQMRSAPWPSLSVHGRVQGRERMHAALAQYHSGFSRWRPSWAQAAMALIIVAGISVASVIATNQGWLAPVGLLAPGPTATSQQAVVAPSNTATATPTTEPSATPTLQIATATSTLTVTASPDSKLATVTPSPSLVPSATASPPATATLRPTQTVLPTATLVMNANGMSPTPRPTDTASNPRPPKPDSPIPTNRPPPRLPPPTGQSSAASTSSAHERAADAHSATGWPVRGARTNAAPR